MISKFQFCFLLILVGFGCLILSLLYENYRIADGKIFGDHVKIGITANKKVHLDVAVSPQEIVDGVKAVVSPKVYLLQKGIETLKESYTEENKAAFQARFEQTKQNFKQSMDELKASISQVSNSLSDRLVKRNKEEAD
jgi:hypothetical protein